MILLIVQRRKLKFKGVNQHVHLRASSSELGWNRIPVQGRLVPEGALSTPRCLPGAGRGADTDLMGKAALGLCVYFNIGAAAPHLTVCKAPHVNHPA